MASNAVTSFVVTASCMFGVGVAMTHARRVWSIPLVRPKDTDVVLMAPGEEVPETLTTVEEHAQSDVIENQYAPPLMSNSDDELALSLNGSASTVISSSSATALPPIAAESTSTAVPAATEENTRVGEGASFERIADAISQGANAFLNTEYQWVSVFCLTFAVIFFFVNSYADDATSSKVWLRSWYTVLAYFMGALTSVACGWVGMQIAVTGNSRTAIAATKSLTEAFDVAVTSGMVMGYGLVSMCVLMLYLTFTFISFEFASGGSHFAHIFSGFGLGGSTVALFGRVGGGIYTKAADVGADLSGKIVEGWDEDDPRNPAVIADNVGDNVGDIAGMGADLFGSLAEAACAYVVVNSGGVHVTYPEMMYPLMIFGSGLLISFITHQLAKVYRPVNNVLQIEPALKYQLLWSTILMTPTILFIAILSMPREKIVDAFLCTSAGLWCGLAIGWITEYFTSFAHRPVRECAEACNAGAAPNIIYGLALGYKSTIVPIFCICATIFFAQGIESRLGMAYAALGILSTLATGLTIDAYGPIADNAGGMAEMAHLHPRVRERTDALDAAGNTTAAIGKGFAIGSAAFVSIALIQSYMTMHDFTEMNILSPIAFTGLMFGAMIPYWFSAMTMRAVGTAAFDMVNEVARQLDATTESGRAIREGQTLPDYASCVNISTQASLRQMIAPGLLVILTPIIVGALLGVECVAGVLIGNLVSGIQIAISASNSGGAWDNAKKYIRGVLKRDKKSPEHCAAVVGDTVGDPLKDTSGPSINILIKLMAITAIVFPMPTMGFLRRLWKQIF